MVVGGFATATQATAAYRHNVRPLRISPPAPKNVAPEFVDYVTDKIKKDPSYDEDRFFRGGISIKTTIDLDLQTAFAQALREVLPDATDPQAALIAVDYTNGDIKAMATLRRAPAITLPDGTVFRKAVDGYQQRVGFNLATAAKRSSGSTIKTFTLATALTQGHSLSETRYGPARDTIRCPGCKGGVYVYGNAGDGEAGRFSLKSALAHSVNTIYVPLANEVGRDKVAVLAEKAGLSPRGTLEGRSGAPANFLSFGIGGGVEVTPLGEAVGYGTFANGGVHVSPRAFTEVRAGATGTNPGQVILKTPVAGRARIVKPDVAAGVVSALTDVVTNGTATSVKLPFTVFGKTGTTNNSTDAWFVGCIPDQKICMASWMGYEYSSCSVGKDSKDRVLKVAGPCGGMMNLHGVKQVYGGTLPALAFTRAQQIYAQIKADRAARAAGLDPGPTPSPTPTKRFVRPTTGPTATATATATARPRPTPTRQPSPTPAPTTVPPTILPPPPTQSPSPGPSP
jgi:penicillin-binding protein 1A